MELHLHKRNLEEFKIRMRKRFPQLTELDLQHEEGKEERMLRMIAYKLHKTKRELQAIISGL
ncbi:MAG: general stress protein CsbD [Bacteroidales bacterium]|nr:general stress protein CsbD [Bacteroidales bacterium]MBK6967237.1 general stress protein CsbD [Bacteroidales bacterium]